MQESFGKAIVGLVGTAYVAGVLYFLIWLVNSRNPEVPAGYVGYQTQGAWFGEAKFYGTLKGPASSGKTWMLHSFPVSITPYTYDEPFTEDNSVLSKDNLKISFRTHVVFKIYENGVKDFVEKYCTINPNSSTQDAEKVVKDAYNNFIKEPFRTFSRNEVQQLDGMKVKEQQEAIGDSIQAKLQKHCAGTPFVIIKVVVGNIQYPKTVEEAVADNLASDQRLEKERKDAARRIVQAESIAKSMGIINGQLTAMYIQHEAIEAQKAMVGSPNHTTIYIPVGPLGIPVVQTVDKK